MAESIMACLDRQIADEECNGRRVAAITMSKRSRRILSVEIADSILSFADGAFRRMVTHYRGVPIQTSAECGEAIWLTSYFGDPPPASSHDAGPICPGCPLCRTVSGTRVTDAASLE